jgi:nicotinamidase-related amidase
MQIVKPVADRIKEFDGRVIFTRDTHTDEYMQTQEGRKLPVPHCIKEPHGWQIDSAITVPEGSVIFDKITFGSVELAQYLVSLNEKETIDQIELVGLCTDICVISNAFLIKAALPECEITVDASLCRGVSDESHKNALNAMRSCQINVINEV